MSTLENVSKEDFVHFLKRSITRVQSINDQQIMAVQNASDDLFRAVLGQIMNSEGQTTGEPELISEKQSLEEELDSLLETITSKYNIVYNKIFVLYSKSQDEYICTYNVDYANISNFLDNTILVHRKKNLIHSIL